jgi:hypothetical protein
MPLGALQQPGPGVCGHHRTVRSLGRDVAPGVEVPVLLTMSGEPMARNIGPVRVFALPLVAFQRAPSAGEGADRPLESEVSGIGLPHRQHAMRNCGLRMSLTIGVGHYS